MVEALESLKATHPVIVDRLADKNLLDFNF